nr:hypothetical protein [Tanacetum cinerariifolium]
MMTKKKILIGMLLQNKFKIGILTISRKYQTLKKKLVSVAQARKNMIIYLKNMDVYKMEHLRGMIYDKVRPIFEREYKKIETLFKPNKDVEEPKKKRVADETLLQSHANLFHSHSPQPYYVTHPSSVIDYEEDYQGELQGDSQEAKLTIAMMLLARAITQKFSTPTNNRLCTSSNTKIKLEQMLLAMKDETRSNLNDEENDFMLDNSFGDETLEELTTTVIMLARIQPADDNGVKKSNYDAKAVSETLKELQQELIEEVLEMINIFESMEQKIKEKSPKEHIFKEKLIDFWNFFIIAVQTPGSGISILLAVGTPSTGSGNLYCQWELSPGSGNALCVLFPTLK